MRTKAITVITLVFASMLLIGLAGCGGENNTIMHLVVANQPYEEKVALEKADSPTEFSVQTPLYASVYFIESPKGMKYTAKWFLNDQEIKSEEKEMPTDKNGVIVYFLAADKVSAGNLKLQILFRDEILTEQLITIK